MEIRRVLDERGQPAVCVLTDAGLVRRVDASSLADLLTLPTAAMRELLEAAGRSGPLVRTSRTLAPVDGRTEVWASGVTYRQSRDARAQESRQASVYELVYEAARPELFLKAVAWKVMADGDHVGIRADSTIDVPEPELALVINAHAETVGYTICNDMSSRSIEGENPLYLPQAKIYAGACALGPGIRPAWELEPGDLRIELQILRDGSAVFAGATSTAELHRRLDDLAEHLFRADHFPFGAVLSTGTGLVPGLEFTLVPGDAVRISIEGLGALTNTVTRGKEAIAQSPAP